MALLNKTTIICLDCEFTGLDKDHDRVIELAAAKFRGEEILDHFDELMNPSYPITKEAELIHHISDEMLKQAATPKEVLEAFFEFYNGEIIVGHGIGLDIEMIERECKRCNISCPLTHKPRIDTLRLARLYGDSPNNSLESLAKHFNIPSDKTHRAYDDVVMNISVFKYLAFKFKTVEKVQEILSKPIQMKYMPLGKHKGRPFPEIPLQYLQWAANMDFDQDLLYSIRLELKKRKRGGGFSQATNPFAQL